MFKIKSKNKIQDPNFPQIDGIYYHKILEKIFHTQYPELYLEIGSRNGNSLEVCNCDYIAIDPNFQISKNVLNSSNTFFFWQGTSDDFFSKQYLETNQLKPDIALIDGLHLFEFALRDFINLERRMKKKGAILIHDVCPFSYEMVTRDTEYVNTGKPWTGDVWKLLLLLIEQRTDLKIDVLDAAPTGLAIIKNLDPNNLTLLENYETILDKYLDLNLEEYGANQYYEKFPLLQSHSYHF